MASASFLKQSALQALIARSILPLLSSSLAMMLLALKLPVNSPASPPRKMPPAPNSVYVKTSPAMDGRVKGAMSGIASVRPLAKVTCVGRSAARMDWKTCARARRRRKAEKMDRPRPRMEPTAAEVERADAAEVRASRSDWRRLLRGEVPCQMRTLRD